ELTPEEFLADQAAQDAVFDHHFGKAVAKYGNVQDAASVWFTGRPRAKGGDAADVFGTTGNDYVAKFERALGTGAASPMEGYVKGVIPEIRTSIKDGLTSAVTGAKDMLDH